MILSANTDEHLYAALDRIGLGEALEKGGSAFIKINLVCPLVPHPSALRAPSREVLC